MRMFGPIPKGKLDKTMTVCTPNPDGTFADPVAIIGVDFQEFQKASKDEHRSAQGGGWVFVDAVNSKGAFSVPVGSRVTISGRAYTVQESIMIGNLWSRPHHWELKVG